MSYVQDKRRYMKGAGTLARFWFTEGRKVWPSAPWKAAHDQFEPCCMACGYYRPEWEGRDWKVWDRAIYLERAHCVGHAEGGSTEPENVVLLCGPCHSAQPKTRFAEDTFRWMDARPMYEVQCAELLRRDLRAVFGDRVPDVTLEEIKAQMHTLGHHPNMVGNTDWTASAIALVYRIDLAKRTSTTAAPEVGVATATGAPIDGTQAVWVKP